MVAQNDPPDDELDDAERFPLRTPAKQSEPVIQLRLASEVATLLPGMNAVPVPLTADDPVYFGPAVKSPITDLFHLLLMLGATKIAAAFDLTSHDLSKVLTPEELAARRSFVEVTFRPETDLTAAAIRLRQLTHVLHASVLPDEAPPSGGGDPLLGHDDQNLDRQWYVYRVRAHEAWDLATGRGVVIGDVDFGFRTTHQDLTNIEPGKEYNSHDGSSNVSFGRITHGTAVLGFAGAAKNGAGMVGIAHDSALWPIQANDGAGPRIPGDKWARGLDHILTTDSSGRRKVAILEVQTSRGRCYEMRPSTNEAVRQMINHGMVVVVAAGNGAADVSLGDDDLPYPETGSILVGATGFHRTLNPRACSSNYGPRLTISAPGYGGADLTCGAASDTDYRPTFGGTSGASPKVAAACAMMLEVNDRLSHADVKQILMDTGTEVITTPNRPAGVFLDVKAAVKRAKYY